MAVRAGFPLGGCPLVERELRHPALVGAALMAFGGTPAACLPL
ncbi:hypothetical protein [Streptomyces sp. 150FB]|nr:hypothetical protein [Streptomyces sp. 150FB]